MSRLIIHAPAKINLCISVFGKRPDGYHDVEMVMQAVGLYDDVIVEAAPAGITLKCDEKVVPQGGGNIAWRAASEMLKLSRGMGVSIEIIKRIPVAAGLGGGSSDAAAVIAACNRLFGLGLSREGLSEIGSRIGMDVPFFFYGPTALARGRGELLTSLPPPEGFWVLLVNPGFETSTRWVYENLNLRLTKGVECNKITRLTLAQMSKRLHNDLESVTAAAYPVIHEIEDALLSAGALGAKMSGSGPTVFGIFGSKAACLGAAEKLSLKGWRLYFAPTLTDSPLPL